MPFNNQLIKESTKEKNAAIVAKATDGSYLGKDGRILRPTFKQRKFLKRYVETGNITQATMESFATTDRKNAVSLGREVLAKKGVQKLLQKYISDDEVLQTVKDQLTAETPKGRSETMVPDNMARLKAADIALKLKGAYPTDAIKLNVGGGSQINFIVSRMEPKDEVDVMELIPEEEKENDTTKE